MISLFGSFATASEISWSKACQLMGWARAAAMLVIIAAGSSLVCGQVPVRRIPPQAPGRQQFSVGQIADSITPSVRQAVEETNRLLVGSGGSAHVELSTATMFTESSTTFYSDRPNQPLVFLGILFPVNLKPAGGDFSVSRNIDVSLRLFCDGGQTGHGSVRVELSPIPPATKPNSFDDIFQHLSDQVNSRVIAMLAANPVFQGKCVAIDSSAPPGRNSQSPTTLITITPPLPTGLIKGAVPSAERIQVTFLSIKRLPAHEYKGGSILYSAVENILLETWVDLTRRELGVFSMKEGDIVNLSLPPLELDAPPSQFRIILNVFQLPHANIVDSSFETKDRKNNYSPGLHVLTISKRDPTLQGLTTTVAAYEITYSVAYTSGNARK